MDGRKERGGSGAMDRAGEREERKKEGEEVESMSIVIISNSVGQLDCTFLSFD